MSDGQKTDFCLVLKFHPAKTSVVMCKSAAARRPVFPARRNGDGDGL